MTESVFTYGSPQLKFGDGSSLEIGYDLSLLGVHRALVVTDPHLAALGAPARIAAEMARFGVEAVVFDEVHVEPTDESLRLAIDWARANGPWDGLVAIGGGSSIDTAKAVNLMLTNPGELMDYVNRPVGGGQAPTEPLLPFVAVPTTTGTGAESTTVCVLDVLSLKVKTGISQRAATADARCGGSGADDDPAGRRHRRQWLRHPLPRIGKLHGAAIHIV